MMNRLIKKFIETIEIVGEQPDDFPQYS